MKTRIFSALPVIMLGILAVWPATSGTAQETAKPVEEATKAAAQAKPPSVYHLEFVVREMDGNKTVNSRTYTMSARNHEWGKSRVGSRIPIQVGSENSFQYQDVGINIDCQVQEQENDVLLIAKFDISSVAAPEESLGKSTHPVLRSMSLAEESLVTPGKPAVIGKLDDVATNHRFEIEVTATKMK